MEDKKNSIELLLGISTPDLDFDLLNKNRYEVDPNDFTSDTITSFKFPVAMVQNKPKKSEFFGIDDSHYTHSAVSLHESPENTIPKLVGELKILGYDRFVVTTEEGPTNFYSTNCPNVGWPERHLILGDIIEKSALEFFQNIDWQDFSQSSEKNKQEILNSAEYAGAYEIGLELAKRDERLDVKIRDLFATRGNETVYAISQDRSHFVTVGLSPLYKLGDYDKALNFNFKSKIPCGAKLKLWNESWDPDEKYRKFLEVLVGLMQKDFDFRIVHKTEKLLPYLGLSDPFKRKMFVRDYLSA